MNIAALLPLLIKASIALTVVTLGLRADPGAATSVLRDPPRLARTMLAMIILMPLFAIALVLLFDLHPAVRTLEDVERGIERLTERRRAERETVEG